MIFHCDISQDFSVLNGGKLCVCKTDGERGVCRVGEGESEHCNETWIRIGIMSGHKVDLCYNIHGLIL